MLKISYGVTTCNEFVEIQRLINFLIENKRQEDEIIVLFDSNNGIPSVEKFLRDKSINEELNWFPYSFDGHFANMKNFLTSKCNGGYIFQIDADEIPHTYLIKNLHSILESNPDNEVYLIPRINTVKGLTQEYIQKWRWRVDEKGWVNFPDYQYRLWKNKPEIRWRNKVHEVLEGHLNFSALPGEEEWCLYHPKTIEKQEKQNEYYNTL
tara:strand:- start:39 stop:665 length:627 start_codon:yes stop_codon:yes gene_type:complete